MLLGHFILMLLLACQLVEPDWVEMKAKIRKEFPKVQQLSIEEFRKKYLDEAFLVDVRETEEYEVSHLKGAKNSGARDEIISEFKKSGKKVLVLYCSVGYRSSRMAKKIQSKIAQPVYNLEGSIFEWANSGLPVYQGQKKADKVHPYNAFWGKLLKKKFRN